MRVGPPRINLAMFRQTSHASSIKFGLLMTLILTGWHLQARGRVWNRILLILCNENWKPRKKTSRTNTHPIYFFLCQQSFSFFPARVATRKINLGVGVLVWDPMVWIRWDCLNFLHTVPPSAAAFAGRVESCVWAWLASLDHWKPYVPETLDAFTPTSNNLANHTPIN